MEFTVEDLSPVKKKVNITVSPEEVAAALASTVATIGKGLQMDGFRKGKVPASVVRKRFHNSLEREARENLMNVHIHTVLSDVGMKPVSPILMHGDENPFQEGQPFEYSMEFEVLPKFDLPNYDGIEVEELSAEADEAKCERVMRLLSGRLARLVPVEGSEPVKDGQIAVVDFEFLENGEPLADYKGNNMELAIGAGQALQDFENLVKTIPVGHTATAPITFPDDFIAPQVAGKTLDAKVTVHAVKEKLLPEMDEDLAKKLGYNDLEHMRRVAEVVSTSTTKLMNKSHSQHTILERLLKQVDFEVPESLVQGELALLIGDYVTRQEESGKRVAYDQETREELRARFMPDAEKKARESVLLLTVADAENLIISPQELAESVAKEAEKLGENPREYLQKLESAGMLGTLQRHMLCDKAMDLIYERASVKIVPELGAQTDGDAPSQEAADVQ